MTSQSLSLFGVRFAPSPTGAFHIGNFRTAWISHALARKLHEPWVVRYEDIDQPRIVQGAAERQRAEMARLGLVADIEALQSERWKRHFEAFTRAAREGKVYPCFCSRKSVREALEGLASAPHMEPPLYSGHCRELGGHCATDLPTVAWRFRSGGGEGTQDFIVARTATPVAGEPINEKNFVPAYNWAAAIDDVDGRYRLLVRAHDLAHAAAQQREVQRLMLEWDGLTGHAAEALIPAIFHTALVVTDEGSRLEKRTQGVTLDDLERSGITAQKLVRLFEASADWPPAELIVPGALLGEARETFRLSELFGGEI